jgi:hypothetical protein
MSPPDPPARDFDDGVAPGAPAEAGPVDDASSEFMSESSPEVQAMWAPATPPTPPAPLPSPAVHETRPVVTPPVVRPSADLFRRTPPDERVASATVADAAVEPSVLRIDSALGRSAADILRPALKVGEAPTEPARPPTGGRVTWLVIGAIAVIGAAIGTTAVWRERAATAPRPAGPTAARAGTASIVSRPAGAEVFVNGTSRGVTPLQLTLPLGAYEVELRNGSAKRLLSLTIDPAIAVREFVDLAPDSGRGAVAVSTDPAGARVTIDGVPRGAAPLTITDVEPGTHRIGMTNNGTAVFRTVTVTAGTTTSVAAAVAPPGATGGWLTIKSPLELQVIEGADVVGTTSAARLMLPAGRHDLTLSAPAYDFQTAISAQIAPGRSATISVDVPKGSLSINAAPWADVMVDGRAVGSTPIGNLPVAIGPHDVIWRHPQLGERRQTVAVGAKVPARASVDLTRAP